MAALLPPAGALETKQKQSNHKFELYRTRGLPPDYTDPAIQAAYNAFPFPKPGVYQGPSRPLAFTPLEPYPIPRGPGGRKPHTILAARKRVARKLEARHMRFARELGYGGNGVAALFYTSNISPPYNRKDYVVKVNHIEAPHTRQAFLYERATTGMFANAMHIVQLADFPSVKPTPRQSRRRRGLQPQDEEDEEGEGQWTPDREDIGDVMFLEYCHRGSLDKALCKAEKDNLVFPNRALWSMFHCLIKSCMAMAYPPLFNAAHYVKEGRLPPYRERFRPMKEKVNFLHLDIDPNNVLVGDPENDASTGHGVIPRLKLSDFGLSRRIDPHFFDDQYLMLIMRDMAKYYFFTPEQFTEEWDYLPRGSGPRDVLGRPNVAGNFSWRTNLFQVGLVMACLITKHYPPLPPRPHRIRIPPFDRDTDFDDDDYDVEDMPRPTRGDAHGIVPAPDIDASSLDGPEVRADWPRVWSYGGYLLDKGYEEVGRVDRELRLLVAQCLCDDPFFRPRMGMLDRRVKRAIRERGWRDEGWEDGDGDGDEEGSSPGYGPSEGSGDGSGDGGGADGNGGDGGSDGDDETMAKWGKKIFGGPPSYQRAAK